MATVDRIAQTGIWQLVLRPQCELMFDVALVFDTSPSMALWLRFRRDVCRLLSRYGEFRRLEFWKLVFTESGEIVLRSPRSQTQYPTSRLITPDRRRLVLVMSDCVAPSWRDRGIWDVLHDWSRSMPTAIVQVFPEHLWPQTALGLASAVQLRVEPHDDRVALPSQGLTATAHSLLARKRIATATTTGALRLPIVTLESQPLRAWARLVAGDRQVRVPGILWESLEALESRRSNPKEQQTTATPRPAPTLDRLDLFLRTASPTARELAALLASSPLVMLPIVRIIQRALLPRSRPSHVAEVFASGLFRVASGEPPTLDNAETVIYQLAESEYRSRLLERVPTLDRVVVIEQVSSYVVRGLNTSISSFRALLCDPRRAVLGTAEGDRAVNFFSAFATVTADVLRGLGSQYDSFVESLERGEGVTPAIGDVGLDLLEFESEVAVFERDNTPELEAFEYESVETIAVLKQFKFRTARIARPQADLSGRSSEAYRQLLTTYLATQFANESKCREFLESVIPGWEYGIDYILNLRDKEKIIGSYVDTFGRNTSALSRVIDALCDRDPEAARYLRNGEPFYYRGSNWGYTEPLSEEIGLDMMSIPGGTFLMGSPDDEPERENYESPQHEVTVSPFFMGRYAITQAQWRIVASYPQIDRELDPNPARFNGDDRPVEQVNWDDVTEFCQRLSAKTGKTYRLPSEAEWEYACRAGTTTPFHFGDLPSVALMNYNGNYTYNNSQKGEYCRQTVEVGRFPSNSFGLCDMHGNVYEWCEDDWHNSYEGAPTDGSVWLKENHAESNRLLRGGSWNFMPGFCRSAYRVINSRGFRSYYIGFRVVCVSQSAL
jgi:formylglycine-generating enzyme required for sulfatase activity